MPEYLAPGVYVEETSFRARSIQGVGTSTTGFVGLARKGPTDGLPELVTSFGEFERMFGGLDDLNLSGANTDATSYMAYAARAFFNEGGSRLYVARVFLDRRRRSGGRPGAVGRGGTRRQPLSLAPPGLGLRRHGPRHRADSTSQRPRARDRTARQPRPGRQCCQSRWLPRARGRRLARLRARRPERAVGAGRQRRRDARRSTRRPTR